MSTRRPTDRPTDHAAAGRPTEHDVAGRSFHPTIHDVAARARVSKSVVSRVMTGSPRVSSQKRAAVFEAAAELGYRPNAAARHLVQRRTFIVGAVVDDLHNPFFADMLDGVEDVAREHGFKVVVMTGHQEAPQEEGAIEALLELRVDGLVVAGPPTHPRVLARAAALTPVVVVGHRLRSRAAHTVTTDDRRGAEMAVEHLLGLGHRRIAHIAADRTPPARDRLAGYERAMTRAGLERMVVAGDFSEAGGYEGAIGLLGAAEPPTAIFAPNDVAAIGAINAAEDLGLAVPGDVSVVGYDDTALAALRHISLTSVHQPRHALGERAMAVLLQALDGQAASPQREVLAPSLTVRATTAAPA